MNIETLLAQAGCVNDRDTGAVIAPIHLSTTFHRDVDGSYPRGYIYSRDRNPTRYLLEKTLARIEGGTACLAFSSGMAATAAIFQSLSPGDHILLPDDVYHGVRYLAEETFSKWGLRISKTDMSDLEQISNQINQDTRLIWVETPSNPMLKIADIQSISQLARSRDIILVVDSTWTTPLLQRPIELGADLVVHSVTKYLSGHADVLAGAIIAHKENTFFSKIKDIQTSSGAVLDPFSAWLTMRGMRTLSARIKTQCRTATEIANLLSAHSRVRRVYYPGLKEHSGFEIACKQMSDFGAMLSFEVDGTEKDALYFASQTKVFKRATSLGGTESLVEHRSSIEPPSSQTPVNLLRLSIGLEHVNDLIEDLHQALSKALDHK